MFQKLGVAQPEEKKAPERPYSRLPVPRRGLQERWKGTF